MSHLHVLRAGPLTTVQDRGRAGHAHLGVPPSGALDRPAADLANRLVGNPADAAVFETTLLGPELRLQGDTLHHVALTGAPAPLLVDGVPAALFAPVAVRPGQRVDVGAAGTGLRSYLAVSGGLIPEPQLGSRSTDLLGGLGPAPLAAGDRIPLGPPVSPPVLDLAPVAAIASDPVLHVTAGPGTQWLAADALQVLCSQGWQVSERSNRIGLRLTGTALRWARTGDLPSEGMVTGAVQVPPSGAPVVFLADHPVTGGYPVIAVLDSASLAVAAQLRAGTSVRFSR